MKTKVLAIIGFIAFILRLIGDVPDKLPTGSRALLQAYAFEMASEVKAGIGSVSIVGNGNTYFSRAARNGAHALELMASAKFTFSVENGNDPVYLWAQIEDEDGNVLISGSAQKSIVMSRFGFYQINDKQVEMEYSQSLPIHFPGVQSAYAFIRDENGKTIRRDFIPTRNNKILFPVALAGEVSLQIFASDESGEFREYVYYNDGWRNPEPTKVMTGIEAKVENTIFVTDSFINNVVLESKNGIGDNPLFVLTLNQNQLVNFFAMTSEGKFATGYYIKKDKGPIMRYEVPQGFEVAQDLEWGTYYVWFTWNDEEFKENKRWYAPPQNNGDGYGKGSEENPTY